MSDPMTENHRRSCTRIDIRVQALHPRDIALDGEQPRGDIPGCCSAPYAEGVTS